jgi:pimeloyl-ACP methyl ester carboxylesterase
VPGTQEWSPVAGANPFDLTTDVRSVTREQGTVAAAGVVAALDRARAASGRSSPEDPVLLVGHSQGGILAAALACGPDVLNGHRVTHVLTTGAPVGLFPVPESVRVLSVEHADDPVPALDLTPNPSTPSWVTLRSGDGPPVVLRRHALDEYVRTMRGTVGGAAGADPATAAWEDSAEAFLGLPVRAVTEVVVTRGWQNPRP